MSFSAVHTALFISLNTSFAARFFFLLPGHLVAFQSVKWGTSFASLCFMFIISGACRQILRYSHLDRMHWTVDLNLIFGKQWSLFSKRFYRSCAMSRTSREDSTNTRLGTSLHRYFWDLWNLLIWSACVLHLCKFLWPCSLEYSEEVRLRNIHCKFIWSRHYVYIRGIT